MSYSHFASMALASILMFQITQPIGAYSQTSPAAAQFQPQDSSGKKTPGTRSQGAATADKPIAAPSPDTAAPASELQPQRHAANGRISACYDTLARASSSVIDGNHEAFSFWDTSKPNERPFRSVVALNYANQSTSRGAAIIINGKSASGDCDSTTVQVLPTARSCSAIQNELMKDGKAIANLAGLSLIRNPQNSSYILLPTSGGGCAIVAMNIFSGG